MSAFGPEADIGARQSMSALPPEADIAEGKRHVRLCYAASRCLKDASNWSSVQSISSGVITSGGSRTGWLLILRKGTVAIVKEDTETATLAELDRRVENMSS